ILRRASRVNAMRLTRACAVAVLVACGFATAAAFQTSSAPTPGPGGLQPVSEDSRALSPAAEMQTFFLPPGYHVELVASEPMVEDPVLIDWDPNGRMGVLE